MLSLLMAPMNVELKIARIKRGKGRGKGYGKGLGIGPHDGSGCCCSENEASGDRVHQDCHLANLGFIEGATITVVSASAGNLIVKVKDSKVAIGEDIAKKIMVTEKK